MSNNINKNNLRKFLTTASALAMLTTGAYEASAGGNVVVTGNNQTTAAVFTDRDRAAQLNADNVTLTTTGADIVGLKGLDVNGRTGAVFALDSAFALGSVVNSAALAGQGGVDGTAPQKLTVNFIGANDLTLDGQVTGANLHQDTAGLAAVRNNYVALGSVNFAAHDQSLIVNAANNAITHLHADITAQGNIGTIVSNGADGNLFGGNIGGNAADGQANGSIKAFTVTRSAVYKADAGKGDVYIHNSNIADGKTLTLDSTNAAINWTGVIKGVGNGANDTNIVTSGVNTVTIKGDIGVGANRLDSIHAAANTVIKPRAADNGIINFSSANSVSYLATGKTLTFDSANKPLTVTVGGDGINGGDGNANAGNNNSGIVAFTGANNIAYVGKLGNANALAGLTVNLSGNATTFSVSDVTKVGGDVTVTATKGGATFTGDVTVSNNGSFSSANATGAVTFGQDLVVDAGNITTGAGAVTVARHLTATAGNITTGAGAVTVGGTTTLTKAQTKLELGGAYNGNGNFVATNGVIDLKDSVYTLIDAGNINGADIISSTNGANANVVLLGDATLQNVNIGYQTNTRSNIRDEVKSFAKGVTVTGDKTVTIKGNNNTYHISAPVASTKANNGTVSLVNTAGGAGAAALTSTFDMQDGGSLGTFANPLKALSIADGNVGRYVVLNLKDDKAAIYLKAVSQNNGGVIALGSSAAQANGTLGLWDGSIVQGIVTPGFNGGNNTGFLSVNTAAGQVTIEANTANRFNAITFNTAASGSDVNGLVIRGHQLANFAAGDEKKVGAVTFAAAVNSTLTSLDFDLNGIAAADITSKMTTAGVTVGTANTGALRFINSDANAAQVTKVTLDGNVGAANLPLGLVNASGAKELILSGGDVYANNVDAATLTLGSGNTYGINVSGKDKIVNVSGANITLAGITASGNAVANIGTSTESIAEFNFATNNSATVNTGVNIYATNIVTQKNNEGTFIFAGKSTVSGPIGAQGKVLNKIQLNNAASDVTFQGGDIYVGANGIQFTDAAAKATFLGGNIHGSIQGTAAANGIAIFGADNSSVTTVDGIAAGAGIAINKANINGTLNLTNGAYDAGNTTFLTDGTLNLTKDVTVTSLGVVTTTTKGTGTIAINQNYTTKANVGASGLELKEFSIGEKATLIVADTHNVYANITGAGSTVVFNSTLGNTSTVLNIGTKDAPVAAVNYTADGAVVAGDVFADSFTLNNAAAKFTANNFTTKNGLTLTNGAAILADKGTLTGGAKGAGIFQTAGNATVSGLANTGGLNLNGKAGDVVTLTDASVASTVNHNGGTFKISKDTTVAGYTVVGSAGQILDLGNNSFTSTAASAINAPLTIKLNRVTSNTAPILIDAAGATLGGNGVINLVLDESMVISGDVVVSAASAGDSAGNLRGGANNVRVTSSSFLTATVSTDGKKITFKPSATSQAVVGGGVGGVDTNTNEFGNAVAKAINSNSSAGDVPKLLAQLGSMTDAEKSEAAQDMSNKAVDTNVAQQVVGAVNTAVVGAAGAAATGRTVELASVGSGVAAGSDAERFGVWAQVVGGVGTQKQRKTLSGFSSNMMGGLIGADTMLNDNATFGILVSNVNNNIKFKDADSGNKAKANSWVFGGYGSYDIGTTDFFVQGNLTVAQTSVKSNSKVLVGGTARGAAKTYETAKGKYDILGFAAEVVGGYKFKFENSYVSPTVGVRYNYTGDTSYTQTGLSAANQTIKTKATNVVSALAGLRIGTSIDMDGTMIRPEVHGNLSYAFNSPASKTSYTFNGLNSNINYTGPKPSKFGANFGTSVMAEADGFEYGVGYDAMINDKYLGHQGSVKVKVKF